MPQDAIKDASAKADAAKTHAENVAYWQSPGMERNKKGEPIGGSGDPLPRPGTTDESDIDFWKGRAPEPPTPKAPKPPSDLVHPFSHSVIEHHNDGSHTVHHINRKHGFVHTQPHGLGDVRGSAADHDGMLDHVMDHTGEAE